MANFTQSLPDERVVPAPGQSPSRDGAGRRLLPAALAIVLVGIEVDCALRVLHSSTPLTAQPARFEVLAFAVAVAVVAALALVSLRWTRALAVLGPAVALATVLVATAIAGGRAGPIVAAILSMTASWWVGRQLLRRIGAAALGERAIVCWTAGLGPLCLLTLLLGRLSILKWWTMGLVIVVTGILGCAQAARALWTHRRTISSEITGTALGAASAGMILLTIAVAALYTAAPEIQFDPLYGKAYLPALWARTGTIGPLNGHVQLNITGWFQMVASWGHMLGAPATGRYLQLVGLLATPAAVWSWARRFSWLGPLAAIAVAVTPHLFWQSTTADDDLLLALAVFGLTVAVFDVLQPSFRGDDRGIGLALGLLAGTGVSLKTSLVPISVALLAGWILSGERSRFGRRLAYGVVGAIVTGAPPLVLRWIDTGNPVFPAYNDIFKSPYWLPVNYKFNFPFFPHPGVLGPFKAIWDSLVSPLVMEEAAPPGAFGALSVLVVIALLFGWRRRYRSPGSLVTWAAVAVAALAWWIEFRYLRYLIPTAFAAAVLLLAVYRPHPIGPRLRGGLLVGVAIAAAAAFAVSVAQFWNVPNRRVPVSAAIGRWAASDYLEAALPERYAILAFNRLSPPHAVMVTDAFERAWLTQGRDLDATWELNDLFQLHGERVPSSGDAAYARMRAMGVDWVLVTGPDRVTDGAGWLPKALRTHGQPRYSADGWDLYQLVADPTSPAPVTPCDRVTLGVPACWAGPRTVSGAAAGAMTRSVPVCPGQELDVSLTETQGGPAAPVTIQFPGASARLSAETGTSVPGGEQSTYATVPRGSDTALITFDAIGGAHVTNARVQRFGPSCV